VISLSWHAVQPDQTEAGGFNAMHIGDYPADKIDQILTDGNQMNTEWLRRLDIIAGYLKDLQNAGVPVLWRPFHEMTGNWFWWCRQPRYKDLWIQMYNRFTTYHKLNNLLWVYSVNHYNQGETWYKDMYPGNEYVDILGVDVYLEYGHSYAKYVHDDLITLGGGKPIGITENGKMPEVATLKSEQPKYVFWCTWWGFEDKSDDGLYQRNFGDSYVITEDEVNIVPADPDKRMLSTSVRGAGTIQVNPAAASYDAGASVSLTAVADQGFEFSAWDGDVQSTENPLSITMDLNMSIIAVFVPSAGTNLVTNGDFSSGTTGWSSLGAWEGAQAQGAVVDGAFKVTLGNPGTEWWHVQITQLGIPLSQGQSYTLSFKAWADAPRKIFVKIGEEGGEWGDYGLAEEVQLSAELATYTLEFVMEDPSDDQARIEFNFGGAGNTQAVYLDDVVLTRGGQATAGLSRSVKIPAGARPELIRIPGTWKLRCVGADATDALGVVDMRGGNVKKTAATALIDMSSLPPGRYLIQGLSHGKRWEKTVIKF
jgi:hypothetical protein